MDFSITASVLWYSLLCHHRHLRYSPKKPSCSFCLHWHLLPFPASLRLAKDSPNLLACSAIIGTYYPLPTSLTCQRLAKLSCSFCRHWRLLPPSRQSLTCQRLAKPSCLFCRHWHLLPPSCQASTCQRLAKPSCLFCHHWHLLPPSCQFDLPKLMYAK
jgi:hypothetical protein